jgi:ribosome biogenesis protein Nip4
LTDTGPTLITRVYYLPVAMLHLATSVARANLISLGTCFGKFSKTGKFKLEITSLDWLAKYAKYKVGSSSRGGNESIKILTDSLGLGQTFWRTTVPIW